MTEEKKKYKLSKPLKAVIIALSFLLLLFIITEIYFAFSYKPGNTALKSIYAPVVGVSVKTDMDGYKVFMPDIKTNTGIIFYPGAKVEADAYAPLMEKLASAGIITVLCDMPNNFALFNLSAADRIIEAYPGVTWYMMGHSLGGVAASSYASKNADKIEGIIYLASYSSTDLSDSFLRILSIYGSLDTVLNSEAYEKNKKNLPEDFTEHIIEGGNHSGYADYGAQKGDTDSTITSEEQIKETVSAIISFLISK